MGVFPLTEQYREQLVDRLQEVIETQDPLFFLNERIFTHYPGAATKVLPPSGLSPGLYFRSLIRNFELSAWASRPPLIVTLLRSFSPKYDYEGDIKQILNEGPYQCHPQNNPYWVCRVLTELPLIGRVRTRAAGFSFESSVAVEKREGKRVFRVFGPARSGKTHTLKFFEYLAAVQPLKFGVVSIDFGNAEMLTQAADAGMPIELFLAQQMEAQVNRGRGELIAADAAAEGEFPDLAAIAEATPAPHLFKPLSDLQQRARWAGELAGEFVDAVIFRQDPVPKYWAAVFDNCEKAPAEAKEFVRQLVKQAAGIASESASVTRADAGSLRIVLLGDSKDMLPPNVYSGHVLEEDLNQQNLGLQDLEKYFIVFRECRGINLDATRIKTLAAESLTRATEIHTNGKGEIPWPLALAKAVLEKSLSLEALAAEKGGTNGA